MKKILLLSAAIDAIGHYCDAGTELTISEEAEAGHIGAERAGEMVEERRAVDAAKADDQGDGLDAMTIAKLRDLADEEKLDLGEVKLKDDIVAAIRQNRLNPPNELVDTIASPQLDPPVDG